MYMYAQYTIRNAPFYNEGTFLLHRSLSCASRTYISETERKGMDFSFETFYAYLIATDARVKVNVIDCQWLQTEWTLKVKMRGEREREGGGEVREGEKERDRESKFLQS